MRIEEFEKWLASPESGYDVDRMEVIQRYYTPELLDVVAVEGDLDEIFNQQGLTTLWNRYYYTAAMAMDNWGKLAINGSQNPVKMKMHPALLLRDLPKYRSRIKQYKEFCEYEDAKRLEGAET